MIIENSDRTSVASTSEGSVMQSLASQAYTPDNAGNSSIKTGDAAKAGSENGQDANNVLNSALQDNIYGNSLSPNNNTNTANNTDSTNTNSNTTSDTVTNNSTSDNNEPAWMYHRPTGLAPLPGEFPPGYQPPPDSTDPTAYQPWIGSAQGLAQTVDNYVDEGQFGKAVSTIQKCEANAQLDYGPSNFDSDLMKDLEQNTTSSGISGKDVVNDLSEAYINQNFKSLSSGGHINQAQLERDLDSPAVQNSQVDQTLLADAAGNFKSMYHTGSINPNQAWNSLVNHEVQAQQQWAATGF